MFSEYKSIAFSDLKQLLEGFGTEGYKIVLGWSTFVVVRYLRSNFFIKEQSIQRLTIILFQNVMTKGIICLPCVFNSVKLMDIFTKGLGKVTSAKLY